MECRDCPEAFGMTMLRKVHRTDPLDLCLEGGGAPVVCTAPFGMQPGYPRGGPDAARGLPGCPLGGILRIGGIFGRIRFFGKNLSDQTLTARQLLQEKSCVYPIHTLQFPEQFLSGV